MHDRNLLLSPSVPGVTRAPRVSSPGVAGGSVEGGAKLCTLHSLGCGPGGSTGHAPFPSGLWVTGLLLFTSDLQKMTPFLSELGTLEGCNY